MDKDNGKTNGNGNGNGKAHDPATFVLAHQDAEKVQPQSMMGLTKIVDQVSDRSMEILANGIAKEIGESLAAVCAVKLALTVDQIKARHLKAVDKILASAYREAAYSRGLLPRPGSK